MERIREEVWQESSFCIFHPVNITDQTQCRTVSNTSYDCIQTDGLELIHKWFHSDPVISKEHHGFFSTFMCDIHHLFCKLGNLSSLECLKILKFFGWNPIRIVHISLIDNKFRTELISDLLLKLLQNIWTYRCRISIPVYITLSRQFIKNQCKLMEKCRITDHVDMWIVLNIFSETLHGIFVCLWLTHIKCDLLFKVCPSVCHRIVHMYRIPHNIGKKTYCIIMKCLCTVDCHIPTLAVIAPLICRNYFSRGTVNHFPPSCDIIMVIDLQHIRIQMVHQMNG